jgi:2-hydroxycyclohexanecarboxyl-CoA dehydrogenase
MRLDGKTAVVTGAASGIGRATAERFAEAGAHVVLGDLNQEAGEAAAAAIRARGQGADFIRLDVTDPASVEDLRREALARRAEVHIVANVAGWGRTEPFVKNTPEFWKKLVDLNLLGPIHVCRAASSPLPRRWRASWRATTSTSTASAPARPTRR